MGEGAHLCHPGSPSNGGQDALRVLLIHYTKIQNYFDLLLWNTFAMNLIHALLCDTPSIGGHPMKPALGVHVACSALAAFLRFRD